MLSRAARQVFRAPKPGRQSGYRTAITAGNTLFRVVAAPKSPLKYPEQGIVERGAPDHFGVMKTLNAFLRCELPCSARIEMLNRICFAVAMGSIACVVAVVFAG